MGLFYDFKNKIVINNVKTHTTNLKDFEYLGFVILAYDITYIKRIQIYKTRK